MPGPDESPDQLESYNGLGNHDVGWGRGVASFRFFSEKKLTEYIVRNSKIYLEQFQISKLDLMPLVDYFHLSRWCEGGVASAHYKVFGSLPQHLPG